MNRSEGEQEVGQDSCDNYNFNNYIFKPSKTEIFIFEKYHKPSKNSILVRKKMKKKENS